MATNLFIRINAGSAGGTITFADGTAGATSYKVMPGWRPAISGRRRDELGGDGPHAPVEEFVPIQITGATTAALLDNLLNLRRALDQAEDFYAGDATDPVLFEYSPGGTNSVSTAANPLQSMIMGPSGPSPSGLEMPEDFNFHVENNQAILNANMRLVRRGALLTSTAGTANSTSTDNGDLATIVMPDSGAEEESPTIFRVTSVYFGSNHGGSYLVVSDRANTIAILDNPTAGPTQFFNVDESFNGARGGSVIRYNGTVTTENGWDWGDPGLLAATRLVAIFANVRNNSSTRTFFLRGRVSSNVVTYTPAIEIVPQASARPRWEYLGLATCDGEPSSVMMYLQADGTAGSPSIDIDSVVAVDVTNRSTYILALEDYSSAGPSLSGTLEINHNLLSAPYAHVEIGGQPVPFKGDPYLHTLGGTVYSVLLGTGGGSANHWRQGIGGGTVEANDHWAIRRNAYLTPR